MSEVTGPISTLPGARHPLPEGTMCDQHPDRPAIARVQGETDSFGSELNDVCQECLDVERNQSPCVATCDWCKTRDVIVKPKRDIDEGMTGPVYLVCDECIKKYNARMEEELSEHDDEFDFGDDYDEPPSRCTGECSGRTGVFDERGFCNFCGEDGNA